MSTSSESQTTLKIVLVLLKTWNREYVFRGKVSEVIWSNHVIVKEIEKQQLCPTSPAYSSQSRAFDYLSKALTLPMMATGTLQLDWLEKKRI